MRRARYYSAANQFDLRMFGEIGFYYGVRNKTSYRLVAIAVIEPMQNNGFGAYMLADLIERCSRFGFEKITLRTYKNGRAVRFWEKMGAVIVGEKGDDYEMKMVL